MFITGAHVADWFFTVCKTERDVKKSMFWTTIMVPRETPGVTIRKIGKISCHHCESVEIFYDNVEVPKENTSGRGAMPSTRS